MMGIAIEAPEPAGCISAADGDLTGISPDEYGPEYRSA
jgi:hypothetical protein